MSAIALTQKSPRYGDDIVTPVGRAGHFDTIEVVVHVLRSEFPRTDHRHIKEFTDTPSGLPLASPITGQEYADRATRIRTGDPKSFFVFYVSLYTI
jgi:hypothetical protein